MCQEVDAHCLCGGFTFSFMVSNDETPLTGSICHCNSCRRSSGGLYVCCVQIPDKDIEVAQAMLPKLKSFKWTANKTVYFCQICGTPIFEKLDDQLWIFSGCLNRMEGLVRIANQIYVGDTKDGGFSEWLKTWEGLPLDLYNAGKDGPSFTHQSTVPPTRDPSDRLHAHCLCGGVEFWIARPSETSVNASSPWPEGLEGDPREPWWLRADRTKFFSGLCACDSCRIASGCDFVQWAFIPTSDISLSADGSVPLSFDSGTLKAHRSSDQAVRYFCSQCSASVFWTGDTRDGLIDVAIGLLEAPEGARAETWLEWRTVSVSFREDAEHRASSLVNHVEQTLKQWEQTR